MVSSSFCLGANYHDLCAEALLGKHAEFSTCSYWKREKNMILKILSSPFAARLLNLADFLASLLLAYYYRRCKHWGHWFNADCFFTDWEISHATGKLGTVFISYWFSRYDLFLNGCKVVMKVVQVIWLLQTTANIIFSVEMRWQTTV